MGLYNAVFNFNEHMDEILKALDLVPPDFERFRDAFVANGEIAIYTRLGGGNKPDYLHIYERMEKHPLFLRVVNDNFDTTYATFFFSIPEEKKEEFSHWDIGTFDPDQRWQDALKRLEEDPEAAMLSMSKLSKYVRVLKVEEDDKKAS